MDQPPRNDSRSRECGIGNDVDEEGFPYIVIEYFKDDVPDKLKEAKFKKNRTNDQQEKLIKYYDAEIDSFSQNKVTIEKDDPRVNSKRWETIDTIAVVQPSRVQVYFSSSLDHPHYTVHPLEYDSFLKHLREHQLLNAGSPKMTMCGPRQNHCIGKRLM